MPVVPLAFLVVEELFLLAEALLLAPSAAGHAGSVAVLAAAGVSGDEAAGVVLVGGVFPSAEAFFSRRSLAMRSVIDFGVAPIFLDGGEG